MNKDQDLSKIGMMFVHWIQVHRESINRFEDFRNCFVDDPNEPVHSKKDYNKAWEIQKEASVLGGEAKRRYEALLEEVDLYLARERTDVLGQDNQYETHRQKAEEAITNGASLTKHEVDL
ncbi:hypothetical protein LEN83_12590 [Acinetobacter baumannii]|nr:hypothetical protein [Acinetobacter baumannii]